MLEAIPERIEQPPTSKWKDTAAGIGGCLLYLAFGLGGIVLLVLALQGMGWIQNNIYPWTAFAAKLAAFVIVPISLLLAIFRRSRGIGAIGLLTSSYVIGLSLWIWSLIVAYTLAGVFWLVVGLVFGGIGVVPIALISALMSAEWSIAGQISVAAIVVYVIRTFSMFLAERAEHSGQNSERLRAAALAYRGAVGKEMEIENTLLSACRHKFGEGYGPGAQLVSEYVDVLAKATSENSHSRRESELPSEPDETRRAIIEVTRSAIMRQENDTALELLKTMYVSLARFLPEAQALLVTERNLGWLSEDPNHPGLRRSKEAEKIERQVDADEERLAQEFDNLTLALHELAKATSDKIRAEKELLDYFYQLDPSGDFVDDILEESRRSDAKEGTFDTYVRDALIAWREGDRERALFLYTKATEIGPEDGVTLVNRGNLQLEMGYFDEGIRDLERARDINPELPWQNALVFKALNPEGREMTRQSMLKKSERKSP